MPDKPVWYRRLDTAIAQFEALPFPWVDRAEIESALGVGRRRAQQILQPLVQKSIGKSGLAGRDDLIGHLRRLAEGDTVHYEKRRREKFAAILEEWSRPAHGQRPVLVEAPTIIVNQELGDLPPGVRLSPGRIVVDGFSTPKEAKQKLLALIMAMSNDEDGFDALITVDG